MTPRDARRIGHDLGFGLMEVMLILLLFSGALAAGFVYLKSQTGARQAAAQNDAVRTADQALQGFAASHFRLPCPDTNGDGVEDCAGGAQKGYLPYRTLGLEGYDNRRGPGRLKYLVYRSATTDLASVKDLFSPHAWDGTAYSYTPAQTNGADFCAALGQSIQETSAAGTAHTVDSGGTLHMVAYALASPGTGDADGDGNAFDGRNASANPEMDSPDRTASLGSYDDQVLSRSPQELASFTDCGKILSQTDFQNLQTANPGLKDYLATDGNLNGSLDGMGLAVDVVNEVNSQKLWSTVTASGLTLVSGVKATILGVKLGNSVIAMATASTLLGTATADLSAAIASCAVIVGCFEIPHAAASVAAATVAVAASATAIAAGVVAIASQIVATGLAFSVALQAGVALSSNNVDLTDSINTAYTAWQDAKTRAAAAASAASSAQAVASSANNTQTNAWNDLLNAAHSAVSSFAGISPSISMASNTYDYLLYAAQSAAQNYVQAQQNVSNAQAAVRAASDKLNSLNTALTQTQTLLATDTTKLQTETDPLKIAQLQQEISQLPQQITDLQNQISAASTDLTSKQQALNTAQSTASADWSLYLSARQNAINAYYLQRSYTPSPCGGKNQPACTPVTITYDATGTIATKIDTWFTAYQNWYGLDSVAQQKQSVATQASSTETQAKAAYDSLVAAQTGTTPPSGSAINVWNGAAAILQAADAKGALR